MKKALFSVLSMLLVLIMLLGTLAACNNGSGNGTETGSDLTTDTKNPDTSDSESNESDTSDDDETETGDSNNNVIANKHDGLIQMSNSLAGGVQAYFTDSSRVYYTLENKEMSMNYARANRVDQLVESIKNTKGAPYIQNTMDVFVRMTDGNTYYASNSTKNAEANLYRFGYYYYEALFEYQDFVPHNFELEGATTINVKKQLSAAYDLDKGVDSEAGAVTFTINNTTDPRFVYERDFNYPTENYTALILTAKALGNTTSANLYVNTGSKYNEAQRINLSLINDGEYHTYYIFLAGVSDYNGTLMGLRFDPAGNIGDGMAIASMTLGKADIGEVPDALSINRHFHVYSDKMHHAIQFAVTEKTENIAEVGMLTKIEADTVSKLIVVTSDGKTYNSFDADFDWTDVVAVGFDVTEAGVFGFILPNDDIAGNIKVELKDGVYYIEQTRTPSANGVSGVIIPSIDTEKRDKNGNLQHAEGVKNNGNDFYIGQRVYTDENHDFAEFLKEADFERNPLDEKRVNITQNNSDVASFAGYDAMRGIYVFNIATPAGGFYTPYNNPNKNYKINFTIRTDVDRDIYVMTSGTAGWLECATLMDENMMLLPVPIEVIKNFSEATGERNLYNISDPSFSEAIFCLPLTKGDKQEYTIINLYQNWGKYPLKQLSQIPFHCPYYHLSTGVTETNCIVPWFGTSAFGKPSSMLPDFRSMTAPFWAGQPQHNSCGSHIFLKYTDSEGNTNYVENIKNTITSYGPTYAEVIMKNISDDGKIKVTYTHMEMPQLDENRTYYTMEYEFLEDLTINSFKDNFQFYSVTDNNATGTYKKLGYLNESNESVVVDSNQDATAVSEYVLGDNCPYFSFFMMPDWDRESDSAEGYSNLALLIYNSEFIVGGEKQDYGFLIKNPKDYVTLTLNISDTVNFKAGDKITINAILLPWGSQQYEDDPANRLNAAQTEGYTDITYSTVLEDGTLYMDKNVRDVRENTLLNPLTVKSETDEVLESPFLPKVKSKDGKTAEFTLSGGENNVAVRIYGFNRLTSPKVEEFVDGEWVDYVLSSHDTPDKLGYYHYYDGYMVNYDEDGTYSYSFVTTMHDGESRKFRISANEEFTPWPEEQEPPKNEDKLNAYTDAEEILSIITSSNHMFGKPVLTDSEEYGAYTSVYAKLDNTFKESYATFYAAENDSIVSGQYLVIKYRVPSTNKEGVGTLEIFTSTETALATESGNFKHTLISDGEWHVDVIDMSKAGLRSFSPKSDGEYCVRFLRVDVFNKMLTDADTHIDFAYIGIDSDLSEICKLEMDNFERLGYYEGGLGMELDVYTATPIVKTYLDPSSGYTESTEPFGATIDYITGNLVQQTSSTQKGGIVTIHGATINSDGKILLSGWCGINGGIEKYVYSLDGGKTWTDCEGSPRTASQEIVTVAQRYSGKTFDDLEVSKINGNFQGGGIIIDLSAHMGKTFDVVFAAVPKLNTETLTLLFCFEDVKCTIDSMFVEGSQYTEIVKLYGAQIDRVNSIPLENVEGFKQSFSSTTGMMTYSGPLTVNAENKIVINGWCAMDGGVEKYVWTADGGKTWHDLGGVMTLAHDGIIAEGKRRFGGTFSDDEAAKVNANFQGAGLIIDLSEYADSAEPLKIYFCAVPAGYTNRVVPLYYCDNVITNP